MQCTSDNLMDGARSSVAKKRHKVYGQIQCQRTIGLYSCFGTAADHYTIFLLDTVSTTTHNRSKIVLDHKCAVTLPRIILWVSEPRFWCRILLDAPILFTLASKHIFQVIIVTPVHSITIHFSMPHFESSSASGVSLRRRYARKPSRQEWFLCTRRISNNDFI